ncbi:glycosyltransferase involved in cell wall biosynthesis [Dysgonomonas sp. PFB1-18]|uniref:glycosyltransferase family 2 protein n=1 Tax=unclassified Dysgonomonas TaxID=2630389 RepID=UPI00247655BA|nr:MULTISPECIES: glycosyltransferase family 2 protein [unclassified Dysgonomonas]MDL2303515.1 glycosyltransferase family 2 protein [Dysgonomonas sp. OttesenSCG-928-D17]MDH6308977.1 glycosyltransferase involved in cell wall biosynthesis [Dysgonomonas sp. PF1-14]MDH6338728.1 glycosyltransferase involved in cell wall biosynthesis [Dysgonomonas sp. PF1-16]MDH6380244.1 glycosyltransferase involved in cell wall biosynthesis [Dysgonomonas sp. PFB1-18]MDH6397574.1 glycosyltransferase involved in cell 
MLTLSVIVPCYNEEEVIQEFYRRTKDVLLNLKEAEGFIIFINDGSKDKTRYILDHIASVDNKVKVIHFSRNFGHQPAVTAGLNNCTTDLAVIIDADLQDPPELIPDLIETHRKEEASVVYCVRKKRKGETAFKKWTAKMFYKTMNSMSEVEFPRDTGDFRLIDRKAIDAFNKLPEKGKYIRGLIAWIGFKQTPFYYDRDARLAGETKYPVKKMLAFAKKALLYFSKKPLMLSISLGLAAVIVGIAYALWIWLGHIFGYIITTTGWTSTIIIIIFFGGIQLLTVGVLGQYIGVLFDEVKGRPEYIIEEKVNFDS